MVANSLKWQVPMSHLYKAIAIFFFFFLKKKDFNENLKCPLQWMALYVGYSQH